MANSGRPETGEFARRSAVWVWQPHDGQLVHDVVVDAGDVAGYDVCRADELRSQPRQQVHVRS